MSWSREAGETWWKRLPGIENGMDEMGERGRERSQRREDTLLPSTKRRQRGSQAGRARKLSSGNKNKRDSVSFTFLLTDNRKIGGKVLYEVKHWCVCVTFVCGLKGTGETCAGAGSLSLKLSICNQC